MYGIVYIIRHKKSGKAYGITTDGIKSRWGSHRREASKLARWLIHRAIAKHGADAFEMVELERCDSPAALHEAEVRWIAQIKTLTPDGYNMTLGGGGVSGFKRSEEFKRQVSARFKGRTFSAESLARMSASATGRKASAITRAKMSVIVKARGRSPETNEKIRLAHLGRKCSPEQIERMRQSKLGKPAHPNAGLVNSRPVVAEGFEFKSLMAAAAALGVNIATVARRIDSGRAGYRSLKAARPRAKRTDDQRAAMRLQNARPIFADNRPFGSQVLAAEALGITPQGIAYRIKIGRAGYGFINLDANHDESAADRS